MFSYVLNERGQHALVQNRAPSCHSRALDLPGAIACHALLTVP